jgi:hypothetical protein
MPMTFKGMMPPFPVVADIELPEIEMPARVVATTFILVESVVTKLIMALSNSVQLLSAWE